MNEPHASDLAYHTSITCLSTCQMMCHFLGLAKKLDMLRIVDASLAIDIRLASSLASLARFLANSLGSKRGLLCPISGMLPWLE